MRYFGTTVGSPPGLPGGRITGIVPVAGGRITGELPPVTGGATTPLSGIGVSLRGVVKPCSPPAPGGNVRGSTCSGTTGACPQAGIVASSPAATAAHTHQGAGSGRRRCTAIARAPRFRDCPCIRISQSNSRPGTHNSGSALNAPLPH